MIRIAAIAVTHVAPLSNIARRYCGGMAVVVLLACATVTSSSTALYAASKPSQMSGSAPGLETYTDMTAPGLVNPNQKSTLDKAAVPKKEKQKGPQKMALAKGQKSDGSADFIKQDQTSPLGGKKFEWKDGDKSSLMKESSFFQKKFELPDVLSGKKTILADKPVLSFDKQYDTKKASGFDQVYESKKSNLTKEWTGGKAANFEMKESNLKGNASGFDKNVRGKDYYGPLVKKLDDMQTADTAEGSGGVSGHRLFPDEPITVGQVRDLLKNGNQSNKQQQVLKAKPVNDTAADSVSDAKRALPAKKAVFLPTAAEKERMEEARIEKEYQDSLEAQRRADAEAGDVPSSMQRDNKPLLIVPIPEDEAAPEENMPVLPTDVPVYNPKKRPAFAPAVDPYAEKAPNPEDDFIPGEIPAAGSPAQIHKPSATPATPHQPARPAPTPAPAAPAPSLDTPADSVPHPNLPGRLGRNQPNSPAPAPQPRITQQNPVADTQEESEPAPLQDLMLKPGSPTRPAFAPTTTSAANTTPLAPVKLKSNLPVVNIPEDAPTPVPTLPRAVDAKRAKPAADRPSASSKPATAPRTSSTTPAATTPRVAKATAASDSTR